MRKVYTCILAVCLLLSMSACDRALEQKQLSGYYKDQNTETVYCFEINEYGSGEYGGEVRASFINDTYNDTDYGWSAWYVKNNIVYINGNPTYRYTQDYLVVLDSYLENVISENGMLVGKGNLSGSSSTIEFSEDGGCVLDFGYNSSIHGYYEIKNNVVKIYNNSDQLIRVGIIGSGAYYYDVLIRV